MRSLTLCLVVTEFLFVMAGKVQAIATSNDVISAQNPSNKGYSFNWDYVYNYQGSTAVAVDHYWILTASHVADDGKSTTNLTIGGEVYTQQEIVFHDSADLALVRYDKPLPGYYLIPDAGATVRNKQAIMVGFGRTGPVYESSFAETSSTEGTKRWGTQKIDSDYNFTNTGSDGVNSWTSYWLAVNFDRSDTLYEAGANTYDSGGGIFYNDSGMWKVAGINAYILGSREGNYAVSVRRYNSWIKSVIVDYDTDMDGLPDHWETSTGETEATADPDEDGFTNYEEWLADTLPNNSNSYLRVTDYSSATNLTFSSSVDRKYLIEYRTNLTAGAWMEFGDWFSPASTQTVQSISVADSNRFYRVRAKLR